MLSNFIAFNTCIKNGTKIKIAKTLVEIDVNAAIMIDRITTKGIS